MNTATTEKSPAFCAGYAVGVNLVGGSEGQREVISGLDNMTYTERLALLLAFKTRSGEVEVGGDGQLYAIDEAGKRTLVA